MVDLNSQITDYLVSVNKTRVKTYIAEIKGFPGCIVEGDTLDEALCDIEKAYILWLKYFSENQIEPQPFKSFKLTDQMKEEIERGQTVQLSGELVLSAVSDEQRRYPFSTQEGHRIVAIAATESSQAMNPAVVRKDPRENSTQQQRYPDLENH